ncbi:MAG: hypothetical protein HY905_00315 [Deltaproteobacteria bacterium]|nr:hypothetical protein [Deltaproteobacteria bacterium]
MNATTAKVLDAGGACTENGDGVGRVGVGRRSRRCGCVHADATRDKVIDVGAARDAVRGQPTDRWPRWHFGNGFTELAGTTRFRGVGVVGIHEFELAANGGGRRGVVHGDGMELGVCEDDDGSDACVEGGGCPVRVGVVDAMKALPLRGGERDAGQGARRRRSPLLLRGGGPDDGQGARRWR